MSYFMGFFHQTHRVMIIFADPFSFSWLLINVLIYGLVWSKSLSISVLGVPGITKLLYAPFNTLSCSCGDKINVLIFFFFLIFLSILTLHTTLQCLFSTIMQLQYTIFYFWKSFAGGIFNFLMAWDYLYGDYRASFFPPTCRWWCWYFFSWKRVKYVQALVQTIPFN